MRAVLTRVKHASVSIDGKETARIGEGFLILLGVTHEDTEAQAVKLPILGMGGVAKGEDAAQLLLAGASAVAVGTACFDDPYAPIKVRDGLASLAERQGLNKVSDFTGAVVPW